MTGRGSRPYHPPEYVNTDQVCAWLGRSGAWLRLIRAGRFTCHVPPPEPDMFITTGRREGEQIALWRRERLSEFEQWFRDHVRALAEADIRAMEANVERMKREQEAS